LDRYGWF
jgi:WD40 repeat protein